MTRKRRANDLSTTQFQLMSEFEPYVSPVTSCLSKWQHKIEEMRSLEWPYWKIAEWLLSEHQLTIHKDTIRKFCIRRNITKGSSEPRREITPKSEATLPGGPSKTSNQNQPIQP